MTTILVLVVMATSQSGPPVPILPLQNGTDMSLPKQDEKVCYYS